MQLNEYQERAMSTCMPSCDNFAYMMLNLVGEVGEFSSKVAKAIRKAESSILSNELNTHRTIALDDDFREELKKEAGDILWQLAGLCNVMEWTLEDVAEENLEKLASRKLRGLIDGEGDNR